MPTSLLLPPLHRHTQPHLLLLLLVMPCLVVIPVDAAHASPFNASTYSSATNTAATNASATTSPVSSSDSFTTSISSSSDPTSVTAPPVLTLTKLLSTMVGSLPHPTSSNITMVDAPFINSTSSPNTSCLPSSLAVEESTTPSSDEIDTLSAQEQQPTGPQFLESYKADIRQNTVVRNANESAQPSEITFPSMFFETGASFEANETYLGELELRGWSGADIGLTILKGLVMLTIILVAMLGNILVIVSIALHRRLHSTANYLLVSLATADMLVALCAMTFNASVELSGGRWMFGSIMCDLWNSFDVYFSTVSILHLCCISVDRYYAIVRPLEYPLTITRRILSIMLAHCWLAPTLISFVPIFFGWYTTADHIKARDSQPYVCAFVVNAVFALVSSAVSFWVPCTVMIVMYFRIFQEARKQERALLSRASSANSTAYSASVRHSTGSQQQQQQQDPAASAAVARQQLLVALQSTNFTPTTRHQEFLMKTLSDTSSTVSVATTSSGMPSIGPSGSSSSRSSSGGGAVINSMIAGNGNSGTAKAGTSNGNSASNWRHARHGSTASWHGPQRHSSLVPCNRRLHSTPIVTSKPCQPPVGRREHKAARTLGLIMGAFVLCWLPFFIWYVSVNICGPSCHCPPAVVTTLFWIGYFNSTLNPFIYAYFRTDFRDAFHRTLKRLSCCRPRQPAGVFV